MWQINRHVATTIPPHPRYQVALGNPAEGLREPRLNLAPTELGVMQCHFDLLEKVPLHLDDAYVRGADLIATYVSPADPIRRQIYWRYRPEDETIELIISIQNQRLDGQPGMQLRSRYHSGRVWQMTSAGQFVDWTHIDQVTPPTGVAVVELDGDRLFFEMVHPSDFRTVVVVSDNGTVNLTWPLFGDTIEKGVIRRARIRGGFTSKALFETQVPEIYAEFAGSPIPLTT